MIKIGDYYIHKEDISYLTCSLKDDGKYYIYFHLKNMQEQCFYAILSKTEFNSLENRLRGDR